MSGGNGGSVTISIQALIVGYEKSLNELRKGIENLDISSAASQGVIKLFNQAERMVKTLSRNMTRRVSTQGAIGNIFGDVDEAGQLILSVIKSMESLSASDFSLDPNGIGKMLTPLRAELEAAKGELQQALNLDFSKATAESTEFGLLLKDIGIDAEKLGREGTGEALTRELQLAKELAEQAKVEIRELTAAIEEMEQKKASGSTRSSILNNLANEIKAGPSKVMTEDAAEQLRQLLLSVVKTSNFGGARGKLEETIQNMFGGDMLGVTPAELSSRLNEFWSIVEQKGYKAGPQALQKFNTFMGTTGNVWTADSVALFFSLPDSAAIDAWILTIETKLSEAKLGTGIKNAFAANGATEAGREKTASLITALANVAAGEENAALNALLTRQKELTLKETASNNRADTLTQILLKYDTIINDLTQSNKDLLLRVINLEALLDNNIKTLGTGGNLPDVKQKTDELLLQAALAAVVYQNELQKVREKEQQLGLIKGLVQRWFSVYAAVRMIRLAFNDIRKNITELDKTITAISIVTPMTSQDLWGLMQLYTEMALQYGASLLGVYEVSLLYYLQGLQLNDVMTLTAETLKLALISGLGYSEATNYMTNALRSFKMDMQDAATVTDVYAALAASSASSVEELATAMSKTASSAQAVGTSFQETSAMMAVMIEATREAPENIGSAMKSIISRYGELKESPDDILNIDGEVVSLNKVDKALLTVGISIHDAQGLFRGFGEVIMELSLIWNTLDSNTLRYIATIMAGNRQQSRFLALVSSGERYEELLGIAQDSEDAGDILQYKRMDSLEVKALQVKTALLALYTDTGVLNVFKGFYTFEARVLNSFSSIIGNRGIGGVAAALTKIGTMFFSLAKTVGLAFKMISMNWQKELQLMSLQTQMQAMTRVDAALLETVLASEKYRELLALYNAVQAGMSGSARRGGLARTGIIGAEVSGGKLANTFVGKFAASPRAQIITSLIGLGMLTAALSMGDESPVAKGILDTAGLGLSFATTGAMIGGPWGAIIGAGLGLAAGIWLNLENFWPSQETREKRANKAAEEAILQLKTDRGDVKSLSNEIEELNRLSAALYNSVEARLAFLDKSNEIANNYPSLVLAYDAEGNAIIDLGAAYDELMEKLEKLIESSSKAAAAQVRAANVALLGREANVLDAALEVTFVTRPVFLTPTEENNFLSGGYDDYKNFVYPNSKNYRTISLKEISEMNPQAFTADFITKATDFDLWERPLYEGLQLGGTKLRQSMSPEFLYEILSIIADLGRNTSNTTNALTDSAASLYAYSDSFINDNNRFITEAANRSIIQLNDDGSYYLDYYNLDREHANWPAFLEWFYQDYEVNLLDLRSTLKENNPLRMAIETVLDSTLGLEYGKYYKLKLVAERTTRNAIASNIDALMLLYLTLEAANLLENDRDVLTTLGFFKSSTGLRNLAGQYLLYGANIDFTLDNWWVLEGEEAFQNFAIATSKLKKDLLSDLQEFADNRRSMTLEEVQIFSNRLMQEDKEYYTKYWKPMLEKMYDVSYDDTTGTIQSINLKNYTPETFVAGLEKKLGRFSTATVINNRTFKDFFSSLYNQISSIEELFDIYTLISNITEAAFAGVIDNDTANLMLRNFYNIYTQAKAIEDTALSLEFLSFFTSVDWTHATQEEIELLRNWDTKLGTLVDLSNFIKNVSNTTQRVSSIVLVALNAISDTIENWNKYTNKLTSGLSMKEVNEFILLDSSFGWEDFSLNGNNKFVTNNPFKVLSSYYQSLLSELANLDDAIETINNSFAEDAVSFPAADQFSNYKIENGVIKKLNSTTNTWEEVTDIAADTFLNDLIATWHLNPAEVLSWVAEYDQNKPANTTLPLYIQQKLTSSYNNLNSGIQSGMIQMIDGLWVGYDRVLMEIAYTNPTALDLTQPIDFTNTQEVLTALTDLRKRYTINNLLQSDFITDSLKAYLMKYVLNANKSLNTAFTNYYKTGEGQFVKYTASMESFFKDIFGDNKTFTEGEEYYIDASSLANYDTEQELREALVGSTETEIESTIAAFYSWRNNLYGEIAKDIRNISGENAVRLVSTGIFGSEVKDVLTAITLGFLGRNAAGLLELTSSGLTLFDLTISGITDVKEQNRIRALYLKSLNEDNFTSAIETFVKNRTQLTWDNLLTIADGMGIGINKLLYDAEGELKSGIELKDNGTFSVDYSVIYDALLRSGQDIHDAVLATLQDQVKTTADAISKISSGMDFSTLLGLVDEIEGLDITMFRLNSEGKYTVLAGQGQTVMNAIRLHFMSQGEEMFNALSVDYLNAINGITDPDELNNIRTRYELMGQMINENTQYLINSSLINMGMISDFLAEIGVENENNRNEIISQFQQGDFSIMVAKGYGQYVSALQQQFKDITSTVFSTAIEVSRSGGKVATMEVTALNKAWLQILKNNGLIGRNVDLKEGSYVNILGGDFNSLMGAVNDGVLTMHMSLEEAVTLMDAILEADSKYSLDSILGEITEDYEHISWTALYSLWYNLHEAGKFIGNFDNFLTKYSLSWNGKSFTGMSQSNMQQLLTDNASNITVEDYNAAYRATLETSQSDYVKEIIQGRKGISAATLEAIANDMRVGIDTLTQYGTQNLDGTYDFDYVEIYAMLRLVGLVTEEAVRGIVLAATLEASEAVQTLSSEMSYEQVQDMIEQYGLSWKNFTTTGNGKYRANEGIAAGISYNLYALADEVLARQLLAVVGTRFAEYLQERQQLLDSMAESTAESVSSMYSGMTAAIVKLNTRNAYKNKARKDKRAAWLTADYALLSNQNYLDIYRAIRDGNNEFFKDTGITEADKTAILQGYTTARSAITSAFVAGISDPLSTLTLTDDIIGILGLNTNGRLTDAWKSDLIITWAQLVQEGITLATIETLFAGDIKQLNEFRKSISGARKKETDIYSSYSNILSNVTNISYDSLADLASLMGTTATILAESFGLVFDEITQTYSAETQDALNNITNSILTNHALSLKQRNALAVSAANARVDVTKYKAWSDVVKNQDALTTEMVGAMADLLGLSFSAVIDYLVTDNGDGTYKMKNLAITKALLLRVYGELIPEAITRLLESAYDEITTTIVSMGTNIGQGFTDTALMREYVNALNDSGLFSDQFSMVEGANAIFEWDNTLNAYTLSMNGLLALYTMILDQMNSMDSDTKQAAEQLIESNKRTLALKIDISGFLQSSRTYKEFNETIGQNIDNYNRYIKLVGGTVINKQGVWFDLMRGGESALSVLDNLETITGKSFSQQDRTNFYRNRTDYLINTVANQLNAAVGSIVDSETASILNRILPDTVKLDNGLYIVLQAVTNIGEAYQEYLHRLLHSAGVTIAEINSAAAKYFANKNGNEQSIIDLVNSGASLTYDAFGEFLAQFGIEMSEGLMSALEQSGVVKALGGNKMAIMDWTTLARKLKINPNSPEYVRAFSAYNDALILLDLETSSNILSLVLGLKDAAPMSRINLTYLWENMNDGIKSIISTMMKNTGGSFENGILTLGEKTNLLLIIPWIQLAAEEAGNLTTEQLTQLNQLLIETLQSYILAISSALQGNLDEMGGLRLQQLAGTYGINLDFTRTADGLKLSTDLAIQLYVELKKVDAISAQGLFNNIADSFKETNSHLVETGGLTARIAAVEGEIAAAAAKGVGVENARIAALQVELDLLKQMKRDELQDSNSFKWDLDLPGGILAVENAVNSPFAIQDTIRAAFKASGPKKGMMEYGQYYNMLQYYQHIADETGDFEVAGMRFELGMDNASKYWEQGLAHATRILGEDGLYIDLATIAPEINFENGDYSIDDVSSKIQALAQSNVQILDEVIAVLEIAALMELLGDIDANEDNVINIDEIIPKFEAGDTSYNEKLVGISKYLNEAKKNNTEIANILESISIEGHTLAEYIDDAADGTKNLDVSYEALLQVWTFFKSWGEAGWSSDMNAVMSTLQEVYMDHEITIKDGKNIIHYSNGQSYTFKNAASLAKHLNQQPDELWNTWNKVDSAFKNNDFTEVVESEYQTYVMLKHEIDIEKGFTIKIGNEEKTYKPDDTTNWGQGLDLLIMKDALGTHDQIDKLADKPLEGQKLTIGVRTETGVVYTVSMDDKHGITYGFNKESYTSREALEQALYKTSINQDSKSGQGFNAQTDRRWRIAMGLDVDATLTKSSLKTLPEDLQGEINDYLDNKPGALSFDVLKQKLQENFKFDLSNIGEEEFRVLLGLSDGEAMNNAATTINTAANTIGAAASTYDSASAVFASAVDAFSSAVGGGSLGSKTTKTSTLSFGAASGLSGLELLDFADFATGFRNYNPDFANTSNAVLLQMYHDMEEEQHSAARAALILKGREQNTSSSTAGLSSSESTDEPALTIDGLLAALDTATLKVQQAASSPSPTPTPEVLDPYAQVNASLLQATGLATLAGAAIITAGTNFLAAGTSAVAAGAMARSALSNIHGSMDVDVTVNVTSPDGNVEVTGNTKTSLGASFAKGTLMGELGPELVVSGGRYFLAGENGAEFVDLDKDAIVFNHLQTKRLLNSGSSGRGNPITNEKNATSYAKGNISGPAMAGASAALAELRRIRAMWAKLADTGLSDLAKKGGGGGGGGGGGDIGSFIGDLERWYNLLQRIAKLEKDISYEEKLRTKISSDRDRNGAAYYESLKRSLEAIRNETVYLQELISMQEAYLKLRADALKDSFFGKFFLWNEDEGIIEFVLSGKDDKGNPIGFSLLADELYHTNKYGEPDMNAKLQYQWLVDHGMDMREIEYDENGKKIKLEKDEDYEKIILNFDTLLNSRKDEILDLNDEIRDHKEAVLDKADQSNKILQEIVDNLLKVEDALLKAEEQRRLNEIDAAQKERDAIDKSAQLFIDGLNESLEKEQQLYENDQNAAEVDKLRRLLAILQRSGGSASEIRSLLDEIREKDLDMYFDALKQLIDAIQLASQDLLERLDHLIELMTEALEYDKMHGRLWEQVYTLMTENTQEEMMAFIREYTPEYSSDSDKRLEENMREMKLAIDTWYAYVHDLDLDEKNRLALTETKYHWGNYWDSVVDAHKDAANDEEFMNKVREAYVSTYALTDDPNKALEAADKIVREKYPVAQAEEKTENKQTTKVQNGTGSGTKSNPIKLVKISYGTRVRNTNHVTGNAGGSVSGPATLRNGASGKLVATAKAGYKFDGWMTSGPIKLTSGAASTTVTATNGSAEGMEASVTAYFVAIHLTPEFAQTKMDELITSKTGARLPGFATGGLANYTGLAMVHGSPSRPEAFLNAEETRMWKEQILSSGGRGSLANLLLDFRSSIAGMADNSTYGTIGTAGNIGDITVNMNVASISNDYDVRQAAETAMDEIVKIARRTTSVQVRR